MTYDGGEGESSLWNEEEGFYFDAIQWSAGRPQQIPVRSLVGLIPLFATLTLEPSVIDRLPDFKRRLERFLNTRPEVSQRNMTGESSEVIDVHFHLKLSFLVDGQGDRILLALASKERLTRILEKMLDETEFLSDYGIRSYVPRLLSSFFGHLISTAISLSKYHQANPFSMEVNGENFGVEYWPGDSRSGMFGGNSNWRGPIWLATNFLLIESLQRFHQYYGNGFKVRGFPLSLGTSVAHVSRGLRSSVQLVVEI